jgi:hypothetical protein
VPTTGAPSISLYVTPPPFEIVPPGQRGVSGVGQRAEAAERATREVDPWPIRVRASTLTPKARVRRAQLQPPEAGDSVGAAKT